MKSIFKRTCGIRQTCRRHCCDSTVISHNCQPYDTLYMHYIVAWSLLFMPEYFDIWLSWTTHLSVFTIEQPLWRWVRSKKVENRYKKRNFLHCSLVGQGKKEAATMSNFTLDLCEKKKKLHTSIAICIDTNSFDMQLTISIAWYESF